MGLQSKIIIVNFSKCLPSMNSKGWQWYVIKHYITYAYCTYTFESTNQRRINSYCIYFSLKKLFIYLFCISMIKQSFFSFWDVLFLLFISLITTNTSCHPLHELFRKNSYVHYIITLENVKKPLIPISHWHYQCKNCISVLWLLNTKLALTFTWLLYPSLWIPRI